MKGPTRMEPGAPRLNAPHVFVFSCSDCETVFERETYKRRTCPSCAARGHRVRCPAIAYPVDRLKIANIPEEQITHSLRMVGARYG